MSMIAWAYLDKKSASVDAIKDYDCMETVLKIHSAELEEARADMVDYRSSVYSGMPTSKNVHGGEARLAACIDEIDVLRERYRRALEFMEWFKPAWDALSKDERFVLTEFFVSDISKGDAVDNIRKRLFVERTQVYTLKDRAVARLSLLLYGK